MLEEGQAMGRVAGLAAIKVCAGSGSVGRAGGIYVPATIRRRSETEAGVQEREGTTGARDEAVDVGGREEEREKEGVGRRRGKRDERARSSRGLVEWIHFRNLQKRRRCSASPNDSNFAGPRAASRFHWLSTVFYCQTRALTGNFLGRPFSFTYIRNSSPRLCLQIPHLLQPYRPFCPTTLVRCNASACRGDTGTRDRRRHPLPAPKTGWIVVVYTSALYLRVPTLPSSYLPHVAG